MGRHRNTSGTSPLSLLCGGWQSRLLALSCLLALLPLANCDRPAPGASSVTADPRAGDGLLWHQAEGRHHPGGQDPCPRFLESLNSLGWGVLPFFPGPVRPCLVQLFLVSGVPPDFANPELRVSDPRAPPKALQAGPRSNDPIVGLLPA